MSKKKIKDMNPEIIYEQETKKSKNFYDNEDLGELRLFPDFLAGNSVSGTESTGLIQVAPVTPALQKIYDDVYNYRLADKD